MELRVLPTALRLRRNENHKNLDDMQSPKKKVKLEQTSDKFTNKTVSFNLDDGIDSKKIPKWVKLSQETKNRSVTNDILYHFLENLVKRMNTYTKHHSKNSHNHLVHLEQ